MDDLSAVRKLHREAQPGFRWCGVEMRPYKEDDRALFRSVTRQVLFSEPEMAGELRYFELAAGGFSTLERHEHVHGVMVLRGRGECLLGREIRRLEPHDLITIPPMTWHQFRANLGEPLGFLCMVNTDRDRPQLPQAADLELLRKDAEVAAFLDTAPT
jgi:mannose-6-phosphate isomerase-like protein (cupin superfamily)